MKAITDFKTLNEVGKKISAILISCKTVEHYKGAWKVVDRFYAIKVPRHLKIMHNYWIGIMFGYFDCVTANKPKLFNPSL